MKSAAFEQLPRGATFVLRREGGDGDQNLICVRTGRSDAKISDSSLSLSLQDRTEVWVTDDQPLES